MLVVIMRRAHDLDADNDGIPPIRYQNKLQQNLMTLARWRTTTPPPNPGPWWQHLYLHPLQPRIPH